jgi:hypothetical protein
VQEVEMQEAMVVKLAVVHSTVEEEKGKERVEKLQAQSAEETEKEEELQAGPAAK